jgi:hypothetical protein
VANALRGVPGVERAECSFPDSTATVWLKGAPLCTAAQLIDAVESMGFEASAPAPTLCLEIEGMMCQVRVRARCGCRAHRTSASWSGCVERGGHKALFLVSSSPDEHHADRRLNNLLY